MLTFVEFKAKPDDPARGHVIPLFTLTSIGVLQRPNGIVTANRFGVVS
jgi:hypothetical protein